MKKLLLTTALVMSSTAVFAMDEVSTSTGIYAVDCSMVLSDGHDNSEIVSGCQSMADEAAAAAEAAEQEAAEAAAMAAAIAEAEAALPGLQAAWSTAMFAKIDATSAFKAAQTAYNYENDLYQADNVAFLDAVMNGGPDVSEAQTLVDLANAYVDANNGRCSGHGGAGSASHAAAVEFRTEANKPWSPGALSICAERDLAQNYIDVASSSLEDWAQGLSNYATDVEVLRVAMEDARDVMEEANAAELEARNAYLSANSLVNG